MSTDRASTEPRQPERPPWDLPAPLSAVLVSVVIDRPLALGGGRIAEAGTELSAIDLELDGDIPGRAEIPVLAIRNLELTESEQMAPRQIRFYAADLPPIQDGELAQLKWRNTDPPEGENTVPVTRG